MSAPVPEKEGAGPPLPPLRERRMPRKEQWSRRRGRGNGSEAQGALSLDLSSEGIRYSGRWLLLNPEYLGLGNHGRTFVQPFPSGPKVLVYFLRQSNFYRLDFD
jgi:hypothetical protein